MKNLGVNLCFFAAISLLVSCGTAFQAKRYAKSIKPLTLEYGPEDCYSRAITAYNNELYIAGSDGYAYVYDLQKSVARNLNVLSYPELRDIHVFDKDHMKALNSAEVSTVMSMIDGHERTEQLQPGNVFWDAFDFTPKGRGLLVGDPIDGLFQVYVTDDKGAEWIKCVNGLEAEQGEAAFAASGSIAQMLNDSTMIFVSGGSTSRLYRSSDFGLTWKSYPIPFLPGEGSGAFSVYFWDLNHGVVVGGNYKDPDARENTCFITNDGGRSWIPAQTPPNGYRSHVYKALDALYACGTNGIDISFDKGLNWFPISKENTFAMTYYKEYLYATTTKGKVIFFKAFLPK